MSDKMSKVRRQSEVSFAKAQSQFLYRDHLVAENETLTKARAEGTLTLKKARPAIEPWGQADPTGPTATPLTGPRK